jgi:hypothetical protein
MRLVLQISNQWMQLWLEWKHCFSCMSRSVYFTVTVGKSCLCNDVLDVKAFFIHVEILSIAVIDWHKTG